MKPEPIQEARLIFGKSHVLYYMAEEVIEEAEN